MIEVNGMAHVILTVGRYDEAKAFYSRLMPSLGLECVFDGSNMCYFVGGRTALGLQPCRPEHAGERFVQGRVGLHHICFRARSREDVDKVETLLDEMGAHVVSPAREGARGLPATTTSFSRTRTGSGSRSTSSPGRGCSPRARNSTPGTTGSG